MTNNDILRRLRYVLNFNDQKMFEVYNLASDEGTAVTLEELSSWLKSNKIISQEMAEEQDAEPEIYICEDIHLATFLNGLIIEKRGKKEDVQIQNELRLNNNMIFNKLKIAFNLKAEDVLEILKLVDFKFSKHELSAFFRKPDHQHYRECKDQVLRNFLAGIQIKFRDKAKL